MRNRQYHNFVFQKLDTHHYVDRLAKDAGHEVLRLPPYYSIWNPIELMWGLVKTEVAKNNKDQTMSSVSTCNSK